MHSILCRRCIVDLVVVDLCLVDINNINYYIVDLVVVDLCIVDINNINYYIVILPGTRYTFFK